MILIGLLTTVTIVTGPQAASNDQRSASDAPFRDSPPIACSLTDREKRERKERLEKELFALIEEVIEIEGGVELRFRREPGRFAAIAELVDLESQCCAFLDFEMVLDSRDEQIALRLSGPEGTREFLEELLARVDP